MHVLLVILDLLVKIDVNKQVNLVSLSSRSPLATQTPDGTLARSSS